MKIVAGVDEVGRGCLAGAVMAGAVILNPDRPIVGLADSKKLTPKRRQVLSKLIKENALSWAIGRAEPVEIDEINILQASLLAMKRAVENLNVQPNYLKIDGNQRIHLNIAMETIIKGDVTEPAISAASIIAKVTRDQEMIELDKIYPHYGFINHKGYATKKHREALIQYGITPIHRLSFKPVKQCLKG